MTTTTAAVLTTPAPKASLFATKEQYVAILTGLGLPIVEQSGFIKVQAPGGKMYVAATKTCRRIDLSFEMPLTEQLTKVPHCGVFGKIVQQMVVGTGPEGDLERFEEVLTHMLALPAPVKVVKAPKAKSVKGEKKGWGKKAAASAALSEEEKATRLNAIRERAAATGETISPKTLALLAPASSPAAV